MTLFAEQTQDFDGYKPDSMPESVYLLRSTREPMQRVRELLNDWFSRYPEEEKDRLKADLLSVRDQQHKSGFFELLIHELLIRNGWAVQAHPTITGTNRAPDFLCTRGNESIYVEAKISMGRSISEQAAITRLETVLETVHRWVKSNKFYLSVSTNGLPNTDIRGRELARRLKDWLDNLDHAVCLENATRNRYEQFTHQEADCSFSFDALPHPEADHEHERIIGGITHGHEGGFIQPELDIRSAIEEKANAYGRLDLPYIIAINAHDPFLNLLEDGLTATYGREYGSEIRSNDGATIIEEPGRINDGTFGYPGRPRKQNVSGVLIFNNVAATALAGNRRGGLYIPNIFSNLPRDSVFSSLSSVRYEGDTFIRSPGQSLTEMLGLPEDWPLNGIDEYS